VHERAEVLAATFPGLTRQAVKLQALAGFRTLGSRLALPLLVRLIEDERDELVRDAAARTAAALSGGRGAAAR